VKISFEKFLIRKTRLKPNTKVKIITGSMEPFIYTGEIVECSPVAFEDVSVGSPIIFWNDNKLICHFLMVKYSENDRDYFITKGLGARHPDKASSVELYFAEVTNPKISKLKRKSFNFLSRFSSPIETEK
jgi:signal peptidase I